jgi:hypothetical protein
MTDDEGAVLHGAGLEDRGLVRLGDTVRRPAGPWTDSVHHLLGHLHSCGFHEAPEPLGLDTEGREVLRFLPGHDQGWPFIPQVLTDDGPRELGQLALRLRTALADYVCPPDAQWQFRRGAPASGEAMQHGDLGPWNLLWGDSAAIVGVLDWDFAEPGDPWYDTGFLAWFSVPLLDDERALARGFPQPPNRHARLSAFAEGAGLSPAEVKECVRRAQTEFAKRVAVRGASGEGGPWRTLLSMGMDRKALADREWFAANIA